MKKGERKKKSTSANRALLSEWYEKGGEDTSEKP